MKIRGYSHFFQYDVLTLNRVMIFYSLFLSKMSGYVDKRFSSCYAGAKRNQIFNSQLNIDNISLNSNPKLITSFCKFSNNCKMTKKALVLLAPGAEEMEFVISVDVLRRGGISVIIAGLPDANLVKCSRDVNIKPDIGISEASSQGPYDVLVLPGGLGGAKALTESKLVGELLKEQEKAGKWIAAICAAPTALKAHGIGVGKAVTSYPAMKAQMEEGGSYSYKEDNVVVDDNLITSRGPGTAFNFGLTIVDKVVGQEKAIEVAKGMLLYYPSI